FSLKQSKRTLKMRVNVATDQQGSRFLSDIFAPDFSKRGGFALLERLELACSHVMHLRLGGKVVFGCQCHSSSTPSGMVSAAASGSAAVAAFSAHLPHSGLPYLSAVYFAIAAGDLPPTDCMESPQSVHCTLSLPAIGFGTNGRMRNASSD